MANSNSFFEFLRYSSIDQENKYIRKLSNFIMKLYVKCTHYEIECTHYEIECTHYEIVCLVYSLDSPLRGDSNEYTKQTIIV